MRIFISLALPFSGTMTDEENQDSCCAVPEPTGRCTVEAIVSVDERGQMVLPKELRMRAEIRPGDKLAAIGWERNGTICCIMLYKVEHLAEPVKTLVSPMIKDIL